MDIVFVISHRPHPRYIKRFAQIKDACEVSLVYWDKSRDGETKTDEFGIPAVGIGIAANQTSPFKRLPQWGEYFKRAIAMLRQMRPKVVYVGNFDMLMIAAYYKKRVDHNVKVVYEIGDLHRYIVDGSGDFVRSMRRRALAGIERRLMKSVDLMVMTCEKYYEVHYRTMISEDKVAFLPNMPRPEDFNGFVRKTDGPFTVGFVGSIRYAGQMKMLIRAAKKAGVHVLFAGSATQNEIENMCRENADFCEYMGEYDYASQIADIYSRLDCVYSVYNADMNNVRVALPNKLYEAVYCELPLIVAKDTYLADLVREWGVGEAVSHKNEEELVGLLEKLRDDRAYSEIIRHNCRENRYRVNPDGYTRIFREKIAALLAD